MRELGIKMVRVFEPPFERGEVDGISVASGSHCGGSVMILGMSTPTFTLLHVIISLVGIVSGIVVVFGMLGSHRLPGWTALFLFTTVLTSVTGFGFPVHQFMPSHGVGVISLLVLAVAIYARYPRQLAGAWRWVYVVTALIALYLNVFVGGVQAFEKVAALKAMAPTQTEPPFKLTQLVVLALFFVLTVVAAIRFRPEPARAG